MAHIATFEDVKNIKDHEYLIDVRNPDELKETGVLPHSINIPLGELEESLRLEDHAFNDKYGRCKPGFQDRIVFSCKSGVRAEKAANQMIDLGFTNVAYYKGSWNEWSSKIDDEC